METIAVAAQATACRHGVLNLGFRNLKYSAKVAAIFCAATDLLFTQYRYFHLYPSPDIPAKIEFSACIAASTNLTALFSAWHNCVH